MIWDAVDRLIDAAASPRDLRAHGLHLLAVRRWRQQGAPIPPEFAASERAASFVSLAAEAVLADVRAAYDGAIILLKGPEVGALYPDPALRPYGDLDLLVANAGVAQKALVAAGFIPVGSRPRVGFHHAQPLQSPRFPLRVEIHLRPSWFHGAEAPRFEDVLDSARRAAIGPEGVLAPSSAYHALLIAAHAWTHEPLGRISHLLDTALMAAECDSGEISALAARWEAARLWDATSAMVDWLFFFRNALPLRLRIPARKLGRVEERSVLESHVYRGLAPFWVLAPADAMRASRSGFVRVMRPAPGEGWFGRARRTTITLRHMFMRRSDHERAIGYRS
jgi:hypothetical protein